MNMHVRTQAPAVIDWRGAKIVGWHRIDDAAAVIAYELCDGSTTVGEFKITDAGRRAGFSIPHDF